MLYLAFVILFIIIVASLALFIREKFVLEYTRNADHNHLIITIHLLKGLIKYKYEVPVDDEDINGVRFGKHKKKKKKKTQIKKDEGSKNYVNLFKKGISYINLYNDNKDVICKVRNYLRDKLILKEFTLDIAVGTGEAFYTGILNGLLWTITGTVFSFLSNNMIVQKKRIDIKSDFNSKKLDVHLYCIFSVRIVHIIVVRLKIMQYTRKNAKSKETVGGGISG